MILQRTRGLLGLLVLSQLWIFLALFWIWFCGFLTLDPVVGAIPLRTYSVYCFWLMAGLSFEAFNRKDALMSLYEMSVLKQAPVAARQTAYAFVMLLFYLVVSKDRFISRGFLFSLMPAGYFVLLWTNCALPEIFVRRLFRDTREVGMLLVGQPEHVEKLRVWLERKQRFGFRVRGVLTEENSGTEICGWPVLGSPSLVEEILAREKITQVVLLNYLRAPDFYGELIRKVEAQGVRVLLLSNIEDLLRRKVTIFDDDGFRFITLHTEPLESPLNRTFKRAIDIALSLAVCIFILPPLCVLVWLLQRLQSPGPLFFRQTRAGIQNREFTIVKFRTMHTGNADEARQAVPGDARIFPAGKWLRRLSLDEFPQFFNVLRGEMSVVGPRPHLVEHNREFARVMEGYHLRTFVKPGITGLAQVRGFRGEAKTAEDIRARLQSDMVYLENWSAPLDIAIILRTAWQILFPQNTAL
jgi:putative colanic acid biosynthesis UDP-glucose lipid carrier transferase